MAGPSPARPQLQVLLDGDGAVSGHELQLGDGQVRLRLGPRAFSTTLEDGRVLIGERDGTQTHLSMVDASRSCRLWDRTIDRLIFPAADETPEPSLRFRSVQASSRRLEGTFVLDADTGASSAMIDDECPTDCEPNDGGVAAAALMPVAQPRPVPLFAAGGWPLDTRLPFGWGKGAVPPTWAKGPLKAAAADATRSSGARSPSFVFERGASNTVRYTAIFPSFCRSGIGCAHRMLYAGWWTTWIRPHGTEFVWGTLRWCQKTDQRGCFDMRRVLIHELGHVSGLNHPETLGVRLPPHESIMGAITPARPAAGSTKHRFGSCDVATLQEVYDVPARRTRISRCNDVRTTIRIWADTTSVRPGERVHIKAELSIADAPAYGRLRRNLLDGRSVKLRYRRAGSTDPWATAWMRPKTAPGRYDIFLTPTSTWEYRAVFPAPTDEGLRFSRSETLRVKVIDS